MTAWVLPATFFLGAALSLASMTESKADTSVTCTQVEARGQCRLVAQGLATTGGAQQSGTAAIQEHTQVCTSSGHEVDCTSDAGIWHAGRFCYVRPETPVPSVSDAVWGGRTDGVVMRCTSAGNVATLYWQASAEVAVVPDPARLAQVAVASMELRPIVMGTFPRTTAHSADELGYVGWNMWLWAEEPGETTWGPMTRSASEAGYSVSATASVDRVEWGMGNGDVVSCGVGTPWRSSLTHNEVSPDCGYMYEQDGEYSVTATTLWSVEWSGMGSSGTISLDLSSSEVIRVAEIQVVNVVPSGG